MLGNKQNWASLYSLTSGYGVFDWNKILAENFSKLKFEPVNIYSEGVSYIDNDDGTYTINSGLWKGRLTTSNDPILQAVKTNFQKTDKTNFTTDELSSIIEQFRAKVKPALNELGSNSVYISIYPYGKPTATALSIDKGKPLNPSLPISKWWLVGGCFAAAALAYKFNA